MAEDDQDMPQDVVETQAEASPPKAPEQPPQEKPVHAIPADAPEVSKPLAGETLEAYAARIAGELTWRNNQLGKQLKQIRERDERIAKAQEVEAENQRLRELAQAGTKKPDTAPEQSQPRQFTPPPPTADKEQARFEARVELLGEQLDREHKDEAAAAYRNFQQHFGGIDPVIMRAVLASDNPAQAFLSLGKDMAQYQQLLEQSEDRRRATVFRLGLKTDAPAQAAPSRPRPSAAPAPTQGLPTGGNATALDSDFDPEADCRGPIPADGEERRDTSKYRKQEYDDLWYAKRKAHKQRSEGRQWSYRSGVPKA